MKHYRFVFGLLALSLFWAVVPATADVLLRVSPETFTSQIVEVDGTAWVATDDGAYSVEGDELVTVLDGRAVTAIAEAADRVWLGTDEGLFRVQNGRPVPAFGLKLGQSNITALRAVGETLWVGAPRGLFRIEQGSATLALKQWIRTIDVIDGQVWVGTSVNAYTLDDNGDFLPRLEVPRDIVAISRAGGSIWLIAADRLGRYSDCLRLDGSAVTTVLPDHEVIAVAEVAGEPWLATTNGVFRLAHGNPIRVDVEGLEEPVNTISVVDDRVWLGSTRRAYYGAPGNQLVPIPKGARDLNIYSINEAAGRTWFSSESGAYVFDQDVEVRIASPTHSLLGFDVHFGKLVQVEDVYYDRGDRASDDESLRGDFGLILRTDARAFEQDLDRALFGSMPVERTVRYGPQKLYMLARDAHGNESARVTRQVFIAPGQLLSIPLLILSWWTVALLALAVAPWARPVMHLIMQPTIRGAGSFGAIPFALSFTTARKHLLRRYRRELSISRLFARWSQSPAVPSSGADIFQRLAEHERLLVVGTPEMTRSFLRSVTWRLAAGQSEGSKLGRRVPVFIRLEALSQKNGGSPKSRDIRQEIEAQLASFGGITDPKLARLFLRHGDGILLLDGLGRLGGKARKAIRKFLAEDRQKNLVLVGSSDRNSGLEGFDQAVALVEVESQPTHDGSLEESLTATSAKQVASLPSPPRHSMPGDDSSPGEASSSGHREPHQPALAGD